ncbi:MAG: ABC transporter permease [Bacteroidota bacterium]
MRTSLFIAFRYLFSRRKGNAANIISLISIIGVMVGTAGLIIVLSVFNGFSGIVMSLYDSFDPDIKITATEGKSFAMNTSDSITIAKTKGIETVSYVLEENALLRSGDRQVIATIKGVDSEFFKVSRLNEKIIDGAPVKNDSSFAVMGAGVAYSLSITPADQLNVVTIHVPRKDAKVSLISPDEAFYTGVFRTTAVFSIQQEFDEKFVVVPIQFAREMLEEELAISAIEIKVAPGFDPEQVQEDLKIHSSADRKIQTRLEQHELLYKILKSEKWAVYLILSFILLIAIFNITGSLNMLIVEKKRDIATLDCLGADLSQIRNVFLLEGTLATMGGAVAGMMLGFLICLAQQQFGLIRLGEGVGYLVESYPVEMQLSDFLTVTILVGTIGLVGAAITSSRIVPGTPGKTGN